MRHHRTELIVILGALTAFAPLAIDMYLPAMPTMALSLAADAPRAQFTLASFFLGFALGQAGYGPVADRFGRKPPLYAGLILFAVTSAGCALAPTVEALAALRFLQAIGACAGMVIARAMVRDLFEPHDTPRIYAALMLVMGAAPMLAPLLGSYLLIGFGWRSIFWVLAACGVASFLAVWLRLPESHDRAHAPVTGARPGAARLRAAAGASPIRRLHAGRLGQPGRHVRLYRRLAVRIHRALRHDARAFWLAVRHQCVRHHRRLADQRPGWCTGSARMRSSMPRAWCRRPPASCS
ncbi:MAG: multidrug effflux MFS transporter [Pseudomonadota bacterium]